MSRETIKSIVLLILISITVVLLRGVWLEDLSALGRTSQIEVPTIKNDVAYLLSPKALNISFGGGQMTTFFFDKEAIFESLKPNLKDILLSVNQVSPISADAYFRMRLNKSIEIILPFVIQTEHLKTLLTSEVHLASTKPERIERILFVGRDTSRLFVSDGTNYYELTTSVPVEDTITIIDSMQFNREALSYQSISRQFQVGTNEVLVPRFSLPLIMPIQVSYEVLPNQTEVIRTLASNVFGNRLNFVQEAIDVNQGRVLLYGYGDRALRISVTGQIEYSERVGSQNKYERHFLHNLNSALDITSKLGDKVDLLFLSGIEPIDYGESKGYRFTFDYRLSNYKVVDSDYLAAVTVEIYGDKTKNLKRKLVNYASRASISEDQFTRFSQDDAQFFNMLNKQETFELIYDNFIIDQGLDPSRLNIFEGYELLLQGINDIQIVLLPTQDTLLSPVIALRVGKRQYYIDFYDYVLVKSQ